MHYGYIEIKGTHMKKAIKEERIKSLQSRNSWKNIEAIINLLKRK